MPFPTLVWLHAHKINTKTLRAELIICDVKNLKEQRFLFAAELVAYQKELRNSRPKKKRYTNPLRIAERYEATLKANPSLNKSALAKRLGTSRVRVTQLMGLLRLPSSLRQQILQIRGITEHALRPLVQIQSQDALEIEFAQLLKRHMSQV